MKQLILALILLSIIFLLGYATSNGELIVSPVQPQVIAAAPAQPFACSVTYRGLVIYIDDTDDGAEAYLCFCGIDADDSTYIWLKVEAPATDCF